VSNNYISVIYDEKRTPRTEYPAKLAAYLFNRFHMHSGDKLLEIGCGRGEFIQAFQNLGLDCSAIDMADCKMDTAVNIPVQRVDVSKEPLPYKDNTFDVVYHKSLLEHLFSPEHLIKETRRVLKPGGSVVILTPDWRSQMEVFYEDHTHVKPYDKTALQDLLKIYGFSSVQTELFYQLPVLWRFPLLKMFSKMLQIFISTPLARKLTEISRIKFFRWSVELMVLGTGIK